MGSESSTNRATEGLKVVPGAILSFESYSGEGMFWRHEKYLVFFFYAGFNLYRHGYSNEELYKNDASFHIEHCMNGCENGVSFRSVNYPDYYIRHQNFRLSIQRKEDDSRLYNDDTCFIIVPGLSDSQGISLKSYNYQNYYIRHADNYLRIDDNEDTKLYREDATWYPRIGFTNKVDFVEIDYIQDKAQVIEQSIFKEQKRVHNGTSNEQTFGFSGQISIKNAKNYERTEGYQLTHGTSYKMKVSEVVVSDKSQISFKEKLMHSVSFGEYEEETKIFKFNNPLTVPGHKTYESQVNVKKMIHQKFYSSFLSLRFQ